jgi:hypothetical protein
LQLAQLKNEKLASNFAAKGRFFDSLILQIILVDQTALDALPQSDPRAHSNSKLQLPTHYENLRCVCLFLLRNPVDKQTRLRMFLMIFQTYSRRAIQTEILSIQLEGAC